MHQDNKQNYSRCLESVIGNYHCWESPLKAISPDGIALEFLVAKVMRPLVIAVGELNLSGSWAMRHSTRPATWAEAMEVPLRVALPLLLGLYQSLGMSLPGA